MRNVLDWGLEIKDFVFIHAIMSTIKQIHWGKGINPHIALLVG